MLRIYAFRHAPVQAKGICYGQIDVETALSTAESLAQIQRSLEGGMPMNKVWTSPLERCRTLADAFGEPYEQDARLMEMSFGQWEGMSWTEIYESYPHQMDAWGANWYEVAPPGGESARILEARVTDWVHSLKPGKHLVFTHAGVIRTLRVLCRSDSWTDVMGASVPYLGLERFTYSQPNSEG